MGSVNPDQPGRQYVGDTFMRTATSPSIPVALTALAVGCVARLHEAQLDADASALLRALGLSGARELRLCKVGDPCIVQVGATRIGVSRTVASRIFVIPEAPSAA